MRQSKAPYPAAFRQQIIALVQAGKSAKELSREFGCLHQDDHELGSPSFELVMVNQADFPVQVLCRALNVSRNAYYAWCKRTPSAREQENAQLIEGIRAIHAKSDA